jgi:hypothetical protein
MQSQIKRIEQALLNGERLTGLDILMRFQCMNYKGRIHDLRRAGLPIKTQMVHLPNGKTIAEYFIPRVQSLQNQAS